MIAKLINGSIDVSFGIFLRAQRDVVEASVVLFAEPAAIVRCDALPLLLDQAEILKTRN